MAKIYFEGLEDLNKKLKKNVKMDTVKKVVNQNGIELTREMVKKAEFKKGYQTGTTKRSIALSLENNGLTAVVEPQQNTAHIWNTVPGLWRHSLLLVRLSIFKKESLKVI